MPLLFTESLCLSLFLLATIEHKYYTHKEKSDTGLHLHQSAAENMEIMMDNNTQATF